VVHALLLFFLISSPLETKIVILLQKKEKLGLLVLSSPSLHETKRRYSSSIQQDGQKFLNGKNVCTCRFKLKRKRESLQ
jgi:hypothetical protein